MNRPVSPGILRFPRRPAALVVAGGLSATAGIAWLSVHYWPLALLLPAAAGFAALVLTRPAAVVYLFAVAIPLTSGMERGALIPHLRANEIVTVILVYAGFAAFLQRDRKFELTPVDRALLLFYFFRVVLPSLVFIARGEPWTMEAVLVFFGPVQYFFLFRIVYQALDHPGQVRRVILLMIVSSGVAAGVGFLQALQVPGINEFLRTVYPSNKEIFTFLFSRRVTSVFAGDWNGCGLYLAMSMILALAAFPRFHRRRERALIGAVIGMDMVAAVLTGSLAANFCMVMGLGLLFLLDPESRRTLRTILILLPLVMLAVGRIFWTIVEERINIQFGLAASWIPFSFQIRMAMWRDLMWPYVERHWLLGMGPYRVNWTSEETYYMLLLLKTGVGGVGAYLLTKLLLIRYAWGRLLGTGWSNRIATVLIVHLVMIFTANISGNYFEYNGVTETVWILMGSLAALDRFQRNRAV